MAKKITDDLREQLLEKELDRMVNISEAAEILGVSKATIRRISSSGFIKSYRIGTGRHRRFRKRDLLKYLEANAEK